MLLKTLSQCRGGKNRWRAGKNVNIVLCRYIGHVVCMCVFCVCVCVCVCVCFSVIVCVELYVAVLGFVCVCVHVCESLCICVWWWCVRLSRWVCVCVCVFLCAKKADIVLRQFLQPR